MAQALFADKPPRTPAIARVTAIGVGGGMDARRIASMPRSSRGHSRTEEFRLHTCCHRSDRSCATNSVFAELSWRRAHSTSARSVTSRVATADGCPRARLDTSPRSCGRSPSAKMFALIAPLAVPLQLIDTQIVLVDRKLVHICSAPVFKQLMTAPGVGLIVAAAFVSVVDDARRFRTAHELEAYLGLVPSEHSSGDRRRIGSITKHGNRYTRSLLIEAAWSVIRSRNADDPLKRRADAIAARRGRSIAVVALARRLAGVLWAMWRDDTVYEPARVGQASAAGMRAHAQDVAVRADALARAANKLQRRLRRTTKTTEALMT